MAPVFQFANTWPRYRGRTQRILAAYQAFLENPTQGLHPQQVARRTGMSMMTAAAVLDGVPELFVKLPKRDGLTRYRLTSAMTAREPEQVEQFLKASARRESLIFYAFAAMVICILLIVAILVAPAL